MIALWQFVTKRGSTYAWRQGEFCFGVHRLYQGAFLMYFIFFWLMMYSFWIYDVFIFYGLYMLGGYVCMEIGEVLFWSTQIVPRSFFDVFHFFGLMMYYFWLYDVFIFYGLYMLGGDTMCYVFCFFLLLLVSHMINWLLIYIMRLFMVYVLFYVL